MGKKNGQSYTAETLSEYYTSQNVEMLRSQIRFADYNPRRITAENLKTLKKGIKTFGLVGGIVVNSRTGNTLVSGHQRLTAMDELQHYNPETHQNDYSIRCDLIDMDETAEKELLILLNNPNAQGEWDYDRLADMVPDIDYTNAGLSDYDLSMMGMQVQEAVNTLTDALVEKEALANYTQSLQPTDDVTIPFENDEPPTEPTPAHSTEEERQAAIDHVKEIKAKQMEQGMEKAGKQMAYLMLSFDDTRNMTEFLEAFDFPPNAYIIKGEELIMKIASDFEANDTQNTGK